MNRADERWLLCPRCGAKTRLRLRRETVLENYPLFCPKCRQESLINARSYRVEIIQPDAKTQS